MRVVLTILALFVSGCATPLVSFRLSDDVTMDVMQMSADEERFDVRVEFQESNTTYKHLIQEGDAGWNIIFVECWETDDEGAIDGYDHHHQDGLKGNVSITRTLRVYTGRVSGVDATSYGFAMLPQNFDGSVITNVNPEFFNKEHFAKHKLQGLVLERAQVTGTWQLTWHPNEVRIDVGHEFVVSKDGAILSFTTESHR